MAEDSTHIIDAFDLGHCSDEEEVDLALAPSEDAVPVPTDTGTSNETIVDGPPVVAPSLGSDTSPASKDGDPEETKADGNSDGDKSTAKQYRDNVIGFESTEDAYVPDTKDLLIREQVKKGGFGNLVSLEGSIRIQRKKSMIKLRKLSRHNTTFIASENDSEGELGHNRRTRLESFGRSNSIQNQRSRPSSGASSIVGEEGDGTAFSPSRGTLSRGMTLSTSLNSTDFSSIRGHSSNHRRRMLSDSANSTSEDEDGISIFNSMGSNAERRRLSSMISEIEEAEVEDDETHAIVKSLTAEKRKASFHNKIERRSTRFNLESLRNAKAVTTAKHCVVRFIWSYFFVWLLLVVWVLFIDDIRIIAFESTSDAAIFGVSWFIFAMFWLELLVVSIFLPGYTNSSLFWLDAIAAASIFPFESLESTNVVHTTSQLTYTTEITRELHVYQIIKSIRAASMALRASHFIRETYNAYGSLGEYDEYTDDIDAFNKTLHAAKFGLSPLKQRRQNRRMSSTAPQVSGEEGEDFLLQQNEKELSENSSTSIIAERLVKMMEIKTLGILCCVFLAISAFGTLQRVYHAEYIGLTMLDETFQHNPAQTAFIDLLGKQFVKSLEVGPASSWYAERKVLHLRVHNMTILTRRNSALRPRDTIVLQTAGKSSEVRVSVESTNKALARHSLIMTTLVLALLLVWDKVFREDYKRYIVNPIYNIISALGRLAADPRLAVEMAGQETSRQAAENPTEIDMIGKAIGKFGRLLHVGFGEAGVEIISRNLRHGEFDPVAKGRKVNAIFGFCDIRNFTDLCEVLRQDTMVFTNLVAQIVHESCHSRTGDVNKNIGDAFLVVWKVQALKNVMPRSNSDRDETNKDTRGKYETNVIKDVRPRRSSYVHHLTKKDNVVDLALDSFLEIRNLLQSNDEIQRYSQNATLQQRIPDFKISLGYGMHLGWAIEGAIGSRHKVDASYLSPHVNVSARLEAATKQYGVSLLLSEAFYSELTQARQGHCRPLDRVTLKGSAVPMNLYTYDVKHEHSSKPVSVDPSSRAPPEPLPNVDTSHTTATDERLWNSIFTAYRAGFWSKWKELLSIYRLRCPDDSPSLVMWDYLRSQDFKMPGKFKPGDYFFRSLTSK